MNLHVQPGEFFAIMGPSGCGKSTLLNMLGALDQPTSGEVWIAGENLAHLKNVDDFRAHTVGFVFQLHNLLPTLTAQENIEVPMQGRVNSARERTARSRRLLELVSLQDRAHHLPNQLSGGQRQRIAIARALANNPKLILADEPTGALDSQSGQELLDLLNELNRSEGTTIAVVTHDPRVAQATQRIIRMSDGRIIEDHRVSTRWKRICACWPSAGWARRSWIPTTRPCRRLRRKRNWCCGGSLSGFGADKHSC